MEKVVAGMSPYFRIDEKRYDEDSMWIPKPLSCSIFRDREKKSLGRNKGV